MWITLLIALILICGFLVLYHHILYPMLLLVLSRQKTDKLLGVKHKYLSMQSRSNLPYFTVIIPVNNEAEVISDKIHNLAMLDYPNEKLQILIYCDGCVDDTLEIARKTLRLETCKHLNCHIILNSENQGKVVAINQAVSQAKSELILLSDASSLISIDSLLIAAEIFRDSTVGVVSASYRLFNSGCAGENFYWRYQTKIKEQECKMGALLGAHGACYFFRRNLFTPLPLCTINDDFALPLEIIVKGYKAIYEATIVAIELEEADHKLDQSRRRRIAAGNVQQIIRYRNLLRPKFGLTGFTFFSSKVLRALMPICLLILLVGSLILSFTSWLFAFLFASQVIVYGLAVIWHIWRHVWVKKPNSKIMDIIHYFVFGHLATFIGSVLYLTGRYEGRWQRANQQVVRLFKDKVNYISSSVKWGKWCFDKIIAFIGLCLTAPLYPIIAVMIKIDSKGPVFYKQLRVGRAWVDRTELFSIIKFRTMQVSTLKNDDASWTMENDPRITRVGKFLRKTRLDEWPQLINVLRGEMSLIGPRPERPIFIKRLECEIPFYMERIYGVPPGITGFAQVNLGYDETVEDVRAKVAYDHAYALALTKVRSWIMLDMLILLKSIKVVAFGYGR